jgi:hypothetical protein
MDVYKIVLFILKIKWNSLGGMAMFLYWPSEQSYNCDIKFMVHNHKLTQGVISYLHQSVYGPKIAFQQRVCPMWPLLRDYKCTQNKKVDMFSADTLRERWVIIIETRKELKFWDASANFFREVGQQCHHTI